MSGGGKLTKWLDPASTVTGVRSVDPAGLVLPLERADSGVGKFLQDYGLNDPLNLAGHGGINIDGHTAWGDAQDQIAADAALANTPLPPIGSLPTGGLGRPPASVAQPTYQPIVMPQLLPNPDRPSGGMPMIRDRAFAQTLAPLQQSGWGLGQAQPILTGIAPPPPKFGIGMPTQRFQ